MISLDYQSRTPIYEQIVNQFERLISLGVLKPKQQISSIRELATSLGINPNTVKKAYEELENRGAINTISTKGTFVADKTEDVVRKVIDEKINQCVECEAGYYSDGTHECKPCEETTVKYSETKCEKCSNVIPNCHKCQLVDNSDYTQGSKCTECYYPYQLSKDGKSCIECMNGFDSNEKKCLEMKNGILKKGVFHPLFVSFLALPLCNLYILDGFWF